VRYLVPTGTVSPATAPADRVAAIGQT
jgi:hypothetical protein